MTRWTLLTGALVALTGIVAFLVTGATSPTALIPTAIGSLILVCGILAHQTSLHRHAIHASLVIALLGVFGTLSNVLQLGDLLTGTADRPIAVTASTITFALLILLLALGISSFVRARRRRRRG